MVDVRGVLGAGKSEFVDVKADYCARVAIFIHQFFL
jgi:hypothetical protein